MKNKVEGSFSLKMVDYLNRKDVKLGVSGDVEALSTAIPKSGDMVVKGPLYMNHDYIDIEYLTNKDPSEFDLFVDGNMIVRGNIHFTQRQ